MKHYVKQRGEDCVLSIHIIGCKNQEWLQLDVVLCPKAGLGKSVKVVRP